MRAVSLVGLTIVSLVLTACSTPRSIPSSESPSERQNVESTAPESATEQDDLKQDNINQKSQECFFERIKGIVEIIEWHEDKASLLFYPGEIPLTISRDNIQPYIQAGQSEIKALLKKPLNQHCGKPEISFF